MADGTFAVLMLLLGFDDMRINHCPTELGCFQRSEVASRAYFSVGDVLERRAEAGPEAYFRYDFDHRNGPFGHAIGMSLSSRREAWFGVGQTYLIEYHSSPFKAEFHAMTGLYDKGFGHDLGGSIAFRSGLDLIYETRNEIRLALSFDHRSHIGIYKENPGMETVQFAVSLPFN